MSLHKAFSAPRKQQKTTEEQECPMPIDEQVTNDPFQAAVLALLEDILDALQPEDSDEEEEAWE